MRLLDRLQSRVLWMICAHLHSIFSTTLVSQKGKCHRLALSGCVWAMRLRVGLVPALTGAVFDALGSKTSILSGQPKQHANAARM